MYNKVIMMGRITRDLEIKQTPAGVSVCEFAIAVDRRYQTKSEERKTDFFNVCAWRQAAEFVTRYFRKGSMILVEGELQTDQYTDKNGNAATWYKINAERLSFTGEKSDAYGAQNAPNTAVNTAANVPALGAGYEPYTGMQESGNDTYPF